MDTAQNTKIAFFEIKPWEIEEIKKQFNRYNIEFFEERLTQDNISKVKDVEIISTFIKTELSGHLLSQMPALKFISTRSTGYDHIDKEYCEANGIKVSNVPNYGANTVAEHAVSLLLAIYKRIPESSEKVRSGYFNPEGLTGLDLMGKTIGILGTGNIGQNMAKYVIAFGAHALAYDINPDQKFADLECVKYVGLED
ncbi:hydroxyacid dehydrogenase, partial [candidate division WWE3 bacterium CG_4_9_14_3_um_filter_34_6]